jgi:hypothetical protein
MLGAKQERQMPSFRNLIAFGAAAVAVVVLAPFSVAQAPPQASVDELTNHEGVFLDAKSGKIAKAKAKNEDWIQIAKPKAIELGEGAIIFRWGDKLYLIEGNPDAPIQTMKSFQDNWNVSYLNALKDFQDNWATSYFKDPNTADAKAGKSFQDKWNVSYMKAFKDFIDNWTTTYMKNQNASYMKNQNASYMKALKDFQDNWANSYMKNQNAVYMKNQNASYMNALKDFQDNWATSYMK